MSLQELLSLQRINLNSSQIDLISRAYEFSRKAHFGQKRKSGEEYFNHCVETAATLLKMGLGSVTTAAGLLHDVPEDTDYTLEDIKKEFGDDVAFLVNGVTKLSNIKLRGNQKKELYLDNLRKMFLAMAADIRVVLIKLADRLHNMKTLDALPPEKQVRIAKETIEIYAPIANRLGIGEIKGQLEDLSFKYIDPENYNYMVRIESEAYNERKKYVDRAIKELAKELKKEGINVIDIHGRAKHYYRLFLKLEQHDMDINKIYDLVAIRIVVPTIADCYETLGIVHKKYKPLIGRIKDYISLPKPNGYKSIHTTIFGPEGKIIEVQIRTERMHNEAEYGIAAHWIYTERSNWKKIFGRTGGVPDIPEKDLQWVSQLREWQKETGGKSDEFWASLKIDFFRTQIFAFTPKGDVIDLPENATPVDFAYKIHSEVGDRTLGAKVNNKMVPLDYEVKNGDVVEILLTKDKKAPSRDWLLFVKTSIARSKIKHSLRKHGIDVL
jgi:GTP pyrophosphokinase